MFQNPSVAEFKTQFTRDFPYGGASGDPNVAVLDSDIASAFQLVNVNINPGLFQNQSSYQIAYLYLAAHYLVMNLRASSQGINGQFNFLQSGKGVGSVSESFSIPERILENPRWSILTKTNYGAQYLSIIIPQMAGQMFVAHAQTNP
jgi:hypothetical protein